MFAPLKLILPAVALNVPLFVTLPNKSNTPVAAIINDPPVLMVMFRAVPVPPVITGMLGADEGITTSVTAVGMPPHQLEAVFQLVLVTPIQVCAGATVIVMAFEVAVDC